MIKLKRADYPGEWRGFNLKEGSWYGQEVETGTFVATSGWENNGAVAMYFLTADGWSLHWLDAEETDFQINELPEIDTESKLSFREWLKEEQGIDWNDWDELYAGTNAKQIEEEYSAYYYDGLPKFAQKVLDAESGENGLANMSVF